MRFRIVSGDVLSASYRNGHETSTQVISYTRFITRGAAHSTKAIIGKMTPVANTKSSDATPPRRSVRRELDRRELDRRCREACMPGLKSQVQPIK